MADPMSEPLVSVPTDGFIDSSLLGHGHMLYCSPVQKQMVKRDPVVKSFGHVYARDLAPVKISPTRPQLITTRWRKWRVSQMQSR